MYNGRMLVPKSSSIEAKISELALPKVLMTAGAYPCRAEADKLNMGLSGFLFNNATKQDRYKQKAAVDAKAHARP
jgi:hypothetical protein